MINAIEIKCNLQTLLNILNATGNPAIAIQMLEGIYEEPFIQNEKVGRWDTKKYSTLTYNDGIEETIEMEERTPIIYTFVSYNPFTDTVTYKRNDGWKRQENITLEGWQSLEDPYQLAV